jgi:hypothetical protein
MNCSVSSVGAASSNRAEGKVMARNSGDSNSNLSWIIGVIIFLTIFVFPGLFGNLLGWAFGLLVAVVLFRAISRMIGLKTGIAAVDDFVQTGRLPALTMLQPRPDQIVARHAMQRAGYNNLEGNLKLADIGVLVYHGKDTEPRIYRTGDVPNDATHVRPFAVLGREWSSQVYFPVRFELLDDDWKLVYTSEDEHSLHYGQNFVTPSTWLPLRDEAHNSWSLEVYADNTLIGVHEFGWLEIGGDVRTLFNSEGEIDAPSSRLADTDIPLTVDEMLEEQGGEASVPIA